MIEKHLIILKLKPNASLAEIKKAYKAQVKIWHPDRFPIESERLQKKAHDMFQKITIAYKKLTEIHMKRRFAEDSGWKEKSTTFSKARQERKRNQSTQSTPGKIEQVLDFTTPNSPIFDSSYAVYLWLFA